jgi:hypothetical protein
MNVELRSIMLSGQHLSYAVRVAVADVESSFLIQLKPLQGLQDGYLVSGNPDMFHFLQDEFDFYTPILKAVEQFHRGIKPDFPVLLGKMNVTSMR